MRKLIFQLLFIFLLTGCDLPGFKPAPEPASTALPSAHCSWIWASQPLPELSSKVQAGMLAAGLKDVTVISEVYGENCINAAGKLDHFAAMETDFHITAQVADLTDKNNLGNSLERILVVLDDFPAGKVPGPEPGNISVSFQAGSDELNLMFIVTAGKTARSRGFHGAALIEAIQNK